jgi:DHA2 family multidrug resistance protein
LGLGIAALQIALDKGEEKDWFATGWITGLVVVAVLALVGFVVYELWTKSPVVNLRVLKERTYGAGVLLMTILGFGLYGSLVVLPLLLQQLLGYPALKAGVTMFPRGLGSFIAMPIIGIAVAKFDPRKLLAFGFLGAGFTLVQLSRLNLNAGYWDFFWPQFVQGLALGLLFVPLTTVTMDPIPREQMGNATSLFNLMRNIGGSVGIATAATMNTRATQRFTNVFGAHVNIYSPKAQATFQSLQGAFRSRGFDPVTAAHKAQAAMFGMVQQQAAILAYLNTFRFLGIIFIAVIPLLLILKKPTHLSTRLAAH